MGRLAAFLSHSRFRRPISPMTWKPVLFVPGSHGALHIGNQLDRILTPLD